MPLSFNITHLTDLQYFDQTHFENSKILNKLRYKITVYIALMN